MPPKRSKKSPPPSRPDPNRISTRPKNAVTHPGHVIHTQCSTRRPESMIQAEKAEKAAKRAKKEELSIKQHETAEAIAEYEHSMVVNDTIENSQFPRHRDEANRGNGPKKRPNGGHRGTSGKKRKLDSKQSFENGQEVDSGVEEQPKSKRTRVGIVPANAARHSDSEARAVESDEGNKIPREDADSNTSELTEMEETPKPKGVRHNTLRRTETYIEQNTTNENLEKDVCMLEPEGVEEYCPPNLDQEKTSSNYHTDLEEDEDGSVFVSPLKARKKRTPEQVADCDSDSGLAGTDNGGLEAKRKGLKKTNTGKRAFREMVQEKRSAIETTTNNKRALIKPAGNSRASLGDNEPDINFSENDDSESTGTFKLQPVPRKGKTQQLEVRKAISSQGEDDSLQARKSLSQAGIDRSLQKRSNKAQKINRDDLHENKSQLVQRVSDNASVDAKPQQVKKASKTQGNIIPQASESLLRHPTPNHDTAANKSEPSRTTTNNPISIAKASKPSAPKKKLLSKLKPDSVAIKTANGSLSGDEDQKEREEMFASPVKGSDAQTASKALVKLEKPKSRSKAELLQLGKEDLVTWNNTLEPNYVKYYLSTKTLWSADAKLLGVAQLLYNETLGSKKPLVLTPSSGPIKLLNQKLNDVRNQTGKIAITNLDTSFLETYESLDDYTPKSVANMRIKFAQNLLDGYQFLFGPDVEYEDGSVDRGKRFFNPLILQTFSSVFKHTIGRAPPSFPKLGHPIVALALACVSIERAVRIWAEGIYDASTGKIVAKINPLSNKPSKETSFSSNIWADATNKYVTKITTLKDDIWRELMDEAATYVAFKWENFTATNSLTASDPHAADRDRALFSDDE